MKGDTRVPVLMGLTECQGAVIGSYVRHGDKYYEAA